MPMHLKKQVQAFACVVAASFALAQISPAQEHTVRFSGELTKRQNYRKEFGPDLAFALEPNHSDPGGISGWTIKVQPRGDHPSDCDDFAWVVMPPYRSYNPRYLDTSYGTTAEEAMKFSPREFKFVLNCSDYKAEKERVEKILWPANYSSEEVEEALEKLGIVPQGNGLLWIRDYKISPAPKTVGDKNLGQIDWIRFDVEIHY